MKLTDLLTFHVESFSALGFDFREFVVTTKSSPEELIQLLAFDGVAHLDGGGVLNVEGWDEIPEGVMKELRMTVFTSFQRISDGWRAPAVGGTFALTSVASEATVQKGGVISLPDYKEAKKRATNKRVVRLIG